MIEFGLETIPVTRQCDLLEIARSTFYYQPKGLREEDIEFMRLIDEKYTNEESLLWVSEDDALALASGLPCQQEKSAAPDAEDGAAGNLS